MVEYKKRAKRLKAGDRDYVSNPKLYAALVEYIDVVNELKSKNPDIKNPQPSDYIVEAIMKICQRRLNSWNYIKYDYRDEMLADAYLDCFADITKFNPNLPGKNPFAYFTTIASNAYAGRIKREKRNLYTKFSAIDETILFDECGTNVQHYGTPEEEEYKNTFMQKYEQSQVDAKEKAKQKKVERDVANKRSLI